jgi:hypothetical protein
MLWNMRRNSSQTSPETLLALGYYQYWYCVIMDLPKATFGLVSKLLPGNSDVAWARSVVNRRLGQWNESLATVEAGLDLDPPQWRINNYFSMDLCHAAPIPNGVKTL